MTTRRFAIAAALAATGLGGCAALAPPAPQLDSVFGLSVRHTVASQTLNPEASQRARAMSGFDAQSAIAALAKHRSSFKTPPPTFNVIGLTAAE